MVGSSTSCCNASKASASSRAPLAPRRWPWIALVALTGIAVGPLAEHFLDRRRLDRVVGLRTGAVGVDAVDGSGRESPERSAARMAAAWPATVGRVM